MQRTYSNIGVITLPQIFITFTTFLFLEHSLRCISFREAVMQLQSPQIDVNNFLRITELRQKQEDEESADCEGLKLVLALAMGTQSRLLTSWTI